MPRFTRLLWLSSTTSNRIWLSPSIERSTRPNIAVVKLENELNTLQNEKQQARQVYDQTEKELKAKKAEATRIEQEAVNRAKYELQTFNNQIEPKKRGELAISQHA